MCDAQPLEGGGALMPLFEVLFVGDRPAETVEAQECELQGAHLVFSSPVLVMGRPRSVVRRRLPAADVREVRPGPA